MLADAEANRMALSGQLTEAQTALAEARASGATATEAAPLADPFGNAGSETVASLQAALAEAEAGRVALAAQLDHAHESLADSQAKEVELRAQLAHAQGQLDEATAQLAASQAAADALQAQLAEAQAAAAQAQAAAEAAAAGASGAGDDGAAALGDDSDAQLQVTRLRWSSSALYRNDPFCFVSDCAVSWVATLHAHTLWCYATYVMKKPLYTP